MGRCAFIKNKINRLVTKSQNRVRSPCKRWDTPLLSYGATPRPGGGPAQRLECKSAHAVAHPAAPLAVAGRSGAGHCGDAGDLPRAQEQGDPHASQLFHQESESHGLCEADGPEAADRERRHRKYRAPRRQLALERAKHFLVSCQCRGHLALALVLQGGAVDPLETYGHFTPGFARSLTGKMGTRPATIGNNLWL